MHYFKLILLLKMGPNPFFRSADEEVTCVNVIIPDIVKSKYFYIIYGGVLVKALKTKRGKIVFSVAIILLVTCLVALTVFQNVGVKDGFGRSGCLPGNTIKCAYKSEKRVYDIDEVSVEFFYGFSNVGSIETVRESFNIPCFELYFFNDIGDCMLIKSVQENFISEKYRVTPKLRNEKTVGYSYNHSEIYTVPKELFTSENGKIYFSIYNMLENEPIKIGGTSFCYKFISEDLVILSNQPL